MTTRTETRTGAGPFAPGPDVPTGLPALVVSLDDADSGADPALVGRKAAELAALRSAGFVVPGGLVLTVRAFAQVLAAVTAAGADPADLTGETLELPSEVAAAVLAIAERMGDTPLAVRSSGVAEDGPEHSYAGQYTTVLGVVGARDLEAAVRVCLASAFSGQVLAYRERSGQEAGPEAVASGLAVLVQPLVPAEAAGVAFSANPVSGARDEVLVSAVRGLGERLVSGQASPDEWTVHGSDTPVRTSGAEDALDADAVRRVAELARQVADRAGCPQDIEWAWVAGAPILLQARPVTGLPPDPAAGSREGAVVPPGYWMRGGYTLKPLSPMNVGTLIKAVNDTSEGLFAFAFAERIEVLSLGGWSYLRIVTLPDDRALRERVRRVVAEVKADRPGALVERWHREWRPDLERRLAAAGRTRLDALPDTELLAELDRRVARGFEGQRLHFLVGGCSSLVWGELGVACRDLLGWSAAEVLPLLTGLPGKASEPALALGRLAALARSRPPVRSLLETLDEDTPARLARTDPEFAEAVDGFLDEFGQRCLGADLAEPTMREVPLMALRLLAGQLDTGSDPVRAMRETLQTRAEAVARAEAALAAGIDGAARLSRFRAALARAERAFPLRDDTGFYAHTAWGQVRRALLALAARLVARGQLGAPDQVFLLTMEEAVEALRERVDCRPLAARRAAEQEWSRTHLGPLTYGVPAPGPDRDQALAELQPQDRAVLEPVLWIDAASAMGAAGHAGEAGGPLRGTAASAGCYTGTVRVVLSETQFDRLRPGDVLVCPETTPQWSVLFGVIGALVTDTGGLLSHPSILAREHGIPAVVATGNATEVLSDGQLVLVDGDAGTVRILDEPVGP